MVRKYQLTKKGLQDLRKELNEIIEEKTPKIRKRMSEARKAGDLSENSSWVMAQEEYASANARVKEIKKILKNAQLISKCSPDVIDIGSIVSVRKDGKKEQYTIVSMQESNPAKNYISVASPMGKILKGKRVGDVATLETPKSHKVKVEIIGISCLSE